MRRIVINPSTFHNSKDCLCIAFNERFRIWMEERGFNPASEPTDAQRAFFRDTAYADDEVQLRRTILARIATLDTSVSDPTDDQLVETLEMLRGFKGTEQPSNDWEASALDRIIALVGSVKPERRAAAPKESPSNAAGGAGNTVEDDPLQATVAEPQDTGALDDLFGQPEQTPPAAETGSPSSGTDVPPGENPAETGSKEAEDIAKKMGEIAASGKPIDEKTYDTVKSEVTGTPGPAAPAEPAPAEPAPAVPAAAPAQAAPANDQQAAPAPGKKLAVSFGGNDTQGNPLAGGQKDQGDEATGRPIPKNAHAAADMANAQPPIAAPVVPKDDEKEKKKGKKK